MQHFLISVAVQGRQIAHAGGGSGALINIVGQLHDNRFITPANEARDPGTVAIGSLGAAVALTRKAPRAAAASLSDHTQKDIAL